MKAISDFPARAMPVLPASGVRRRSWPRAALAEAPFGAQSPPRGSVIRRMSVKGTGPADLIPMRNGLLDLATDQLHPRTPRHFNSYSLPFDYDPNPPTHITGFGS